MGAWRDCRDRQFGDGVRSVPQDDRVTRLLFRDDGSPRPTSVEFRFKVLSNSLITVTEATSSVLYAAVSEHLKNDGSSPNVRAG